jgi:hypothetical protein
MGVESRMPGGEAGEAIALARVSSSLGFMFFISNPSDFGCQTLHFVSRTLGL